MRESKTEQKKPRNSATLKKRKKQKKERKEHIYRNTVLKEKLKS